MLILARLQNRTKIRLINSVELIILLLCINNFIFSQSQKLNDVESRSIEGVYEFVSETSDYSNPISKTEYLNNDEWKGIWIFKDGYFSKTLTKIIKQNKLTIDRRKEIGEYESTSGKYEINSKFITLTFPLSQHLLTVPPDVSEYKLSKGILTLTKTFTPNLHSDTKGQVITVLRRVKSN